MIIFFDSWGAAWKPCPPEDPGAEAFGPTGVARRVEEEEELPYSLRGWVPARRGAVYNSGGRLLHRAQKAHQWDFVEVCPKCGGDGRSRQYPIAENGYAMVCPGCIGHGIVP